jgi:hypothetical protein
VEENEKAVFIQHLSVNLRAIDVLNCKQCVATGGLRLHTCDCIDRHFEAIVNTYKSASLHLPKKSCIAKHDAQIVGWNEFVYDMHAAARSGYVQ